MGLVQDKQLEESAVVANCCMNRERSLHGSNGYARDLGFDPVERLQAACENSGSAKWLDLCCGSARALVEATEIFDSRQLPITVVGVDLVGMFSTNNSKRLRLVEASLSDWEPCERFDLITCVHGLHYIGDKLRLLAKVASWLTPHGQFVANLDAKNLRLDGGSSSDIVKALRRDGFTFAPRQKRISCQGSRSVSLAFRYLGADDEAGPNYTGQNAVNSHYTRAT